MKNNSFDIINYKDKEESIKKEEVKKLKRQEEDRKSENIISEIIEKIYNCNNEKRLKFLKTQISLSCKHCIPNNEFIGIYQIIKEYIDQLKKILYNKLWELQLFQIINSSNHNIIFTNNTNIRNIYKKRKRRRSLSFEYRPAKINRIAFCNLKKYFHSSTNNTEQKNQPVMLKSFNEAQERYRKFLQFLKKVYSNLRNENIEYIEFICRELLKLCNTNQDNQRYNIHNTLFIEKILNDKLINVYIYK